MRPMEEHLRNEGTWIENPTQEQVRIMFANSGILLPKKTPRDRTRRINQLKWTTFARDQRRKIGSSNKPTAEENPTEENEFEDD